MSEPPTPGPPSPPTAASPPSGTPGPGKRISVGGVVSLALGAITLPCLNAPKWLGCLVYGLYGLGAVLAVIGLVVAAVSLVVSLTRQRSGPLLPALGLLLCLAAVGCAAYRILPLVSALAADVGVAAGP